MVQQGWTIYRGGAVKDEYSTTGLRYDVEWR